MAEACALTKKYTEYQNLALQYIFQPTRPASLATKINYKIPFQKTLLSRYLNKTWIFDILFILFKNIWYKTCMNVGHYPITPILGTSSTGVRSRAGGSLWPVVLTGASFLMRLFLGVTRGWSGRLQEGTMRTCFFPNMSLSSSLHHIGTPKTRSDSKLKTTAIALEHQLWQQAENNSKSFRTPALTASWKQQQEL